MATSSDVLIRSVVGFIAAIMILFMGWVATSLNENTIAITKIDTKVDNTVIALAILSADLKQIRATMYSKSDAIRNNTIVTTRLTRLETKVEKINLEQAKRGPRIARLEREEDAGS